MRNFKKPYLIPSLCLISLFYINAISVIFATKQYYDSGRMNYFWISILIIFIAQIINVQTFRKTYYYGRNVSRIKEIIPMLLFIPFLPLILWLKSFNRTCLSCLIGMCSLKNNEICKPFTYQNQMFWSNLFGRSGIEIQTRKKRETNSVNHETELWIDQFQHFYGFFINSFAQSLPLSIVYTLSDENTVFHVISLFTCILLLVHSLSFFIYSPHLPVFLFNCFCFLMDILNILNHCTWIFTPIAEDLLPYPNQWDMIRIIIILATPCFVLYNIFTQHDKKQIVISSFGAFVSLNSILFVFHFMRFSLFPFYCVLTIHPLNENWTSIFRSLLISWCVPGFSRKYTKDIRRRIYIANQTLIKGCIFNSYRIDSSFDILAVGLGREAEDEIMVTFKHKLTSRIIRRSFEPFRIKPLFVWKFCSSPADLIPSIQQLRDWVKGKLFIDMMIEWIRTHLFKRTVHPLIDKIFNESNWSSEGTPNSIWSYITSILAFAVFAYIYISSFSYPFLCIYAVGWNQLSLIQQTLTCLIGLTFIAIIILYYPLQFAIDVASLFYSDWFPGTHEAVEHHLSCIKMDYEHVLRVIEQRKWSILGVLALNQKVLPDLHLHLSRSKFFTEMLKFADFEFVQNTFRQQLDPVLIEQIRLKREAGIRKIAQMDLKKLLSTNNT